MDKRLNNASSNGTIKKNLMNKPEFQQQMLEKRMPIGNMLGNSNSVHKRLNIGVNGGQFYNTNTLENHNMNYQQPNNYNIE